MFVIECNVSSHFLFKRGRILILKSSLDQVLGANKPLGLSPFDGTSSHRMNNAFLGNRTLYFEVLGSVVKRHEKEEKKKKDTTDTHQQHDHGHPKIHDSSGGEWHPTADDVSIVS